MNDEQTENVRRIAIVGPECTGKTDLSMALAEHYQTLWVPEYARHYIERLNRPYEQHDLLEITNYQMLSEDELALQANRLLICDTNLIVIKVWSEYKYGTCDKRILEKLHQRHYDLHLLTGIDIPWENDPQREHPDKREYFYQLYKKELETLSVPFIEISGERPMRIQNAIKAIDQL